MENIILAMLNCSGMFGIVLDALPVMYITVDFDALNMYLTLYVLSQEQLGLSPCVCDSQHPG